MTNAQKRLKEHFLEPEVRGNVAVSTELKAAWKVMLDLLEVIIKVCDKYSLQYSLDGGSMLGAIRHKGFIPWDDDIDVALPRLDYDKLIEVLPGELPEGLFLQSSDSDPECLSTHLKLRDSRTTAIDPYHAEHHVCMNMGMFVDIFPIDPDPETPFKRRVLWRYALLLRGVRRNRFIKNPKGIGDWLRKIIGWMVYNVVGNHQLFLLRELPFSRMAAKCRYRCMATLPAQLGYGKRNRRKVEWFKEYIDVPFEYLTVKVPAGYDDILKTIYGDWRTPRKESAYHGSLILDTKKDYKTVLCERFGYREDDFSR